MFGSSTHSAAGTLFSANPNTTNMTSAGTLFGANTGTTNASSGTLFSASNNTSAGTLFGTNAAATNTSSAGTLFGASNTTTATGGGLGANMTATTAAGTAGTFGFGGTNQPNTGFNINAGNAGPSGNAAFGFGSNTATTGAGSFGTNNTLGANTINTAAKGPGGFGFGTNTANIGAGTGLKFGGSTTNTSGSGFGFGTSNAGNTGFGSSTSAFGQQQQQPGATSFGFGKPSNVFGQQKPQQPAIPLHVWQELALLRERWNPTSHLCQFKHYFYNRVAPNEVNLYVRPPNQDEQLWNEAMRKNPDPTCMVPVLAVGFEDILKRIDIQEKHGDLHKSKVQELEGRLTTVQQKFTLGTLIKLEEHRRRHMILTQRLIRVLRYVQVLRYKGFQLDAEEEELMRQVSNVATHPDNPQQLHSKMLSLWSQIQTIRKERKGDSTADSWRVVNEENATAIAKTLEEEQKGMSHVISVLKKDTEDIERIELSLKTKLQKE
ncbi:hypothetical protein DFQ28_002635 [Apophysomyces sp. BC1034]|nr:hypothetical protein DFQ30_002919 [Apophysomyces sp. BC1015]KAG0179770.1 hypothetical protein DFQ29_001680 [Apophysomyces sp. BC1021]KAG0190001.1 hypothetical protein DFQ28_002635 [Apophysomyces sp. BC1034]